MSPGVNVLDVGAGQQIYKGDVVSFGGSYTSHDFGEYLGEEAPFGLNSPWGLGETDILCDILDIPEERKWDLVLCTEVLEHVPDPVAALEKLTRLVCEGGSLLITAPRLSLSHQAPYHFATGLSPFFYEKWLPIFGCKIKSLTLHGDWADFHSQETRRLLRLPALAQVPLAAAIRLITPRRVIDTAGFSVFIEATSSDG